MALVVDTGALLGLLDAKDKAHIACRSLIEAIDEDLVIPVLVLVELEYWLARRVSPDVWLAFCEEVALGTYLLFDLDVGLLKRAAEVQARYADLRLGIVDASVVATCDRLGETRIATVDRRHFGVVRTASGKPFEIVPG